VSALESPVHAEWKRAIVAAAETDTVFLNRQHGPGLRALRTARSQSLETAEHNVMTEFGDRQRLLRLYFGGDLEASIALCGQVAGRIDAVRPVAEILRETADECRDILAQLAQRYSRPD
jgi:enoyl-[acyl-carrier protein] reductase II